jgi:hypothetical protein
MLFTERNLVGWNWTCLCVRNQKFSVMSWLLNWPRDGREGQWGILIGESACKPGVTRGLWVDFRGSVYLYWGKLPLPPQTSNSDVGLHLIMTVDREVICGFWFPEMFVNFSKSHYLNFMCVHFFFREGFCRFHQTVRGVRGTKRLRTLNVNIVSNEARFSEGH